VAILGGARPRSRVGNLMKRTGRAGHDPALKASVIEMYRGGTSSRLLAEITGLSSYTIWTWCRGQRPASKPGPKREAA